LQGIAVPVFARGFAGGGFDAVRRQQFQTEQSPLAAGEERTALLRFAGIFGVEPQFQASGLIHFDIVHDDQHIRLQELEVADEAAHAHFAAVDRGGIAGDHIQRR
jgi:hypothetical protein